MSRNARGPVDPWDHQEQLMRMSGQYIPPFPSQSPEVNLTGVLYTALCLEEVGELAEGMSKAVTSLRRPGDPRIIESTHWLKGELVRISRLLSASAKQIRDDVALLREQHGGSELYGPLSADIACEVADAFTDVHVVAAGGSIAMAMKGPECYLETATSNQSKANPDTGVIDKTPDGKWIKGRDYRQPDLGAVLYPVTARVADEDDGHAD